MDTVIIMGAGASRAEVEILGPTSAGLPPLDTDFLQIASALPAKVDLDTVHHYLEENYKISIGQNDNPRMEEVFGLVYADTITDPRPPGADAAFLALCKIYNRTLAQTMNDVKVSDSGPMGSLIRKFINNEPLTVITFNQDILIERTLDSLGHKLGRLLWFPDTDYEMKFLKHTIPSGQSPQRGFPLSNGRTGLVKLLKLHGSLNWYMRTNSRHRVPTRLSNRIQCTRRKRLTIEMKARTGAKRGRSVWYTWPIIVPPIFEKGSYIGKALSSVWHAAYDALAKAQHIIVWGYSFPDADQQSRTFFRRAINRNEKGRHISVINPDFRAMERAQSVLEPTSLASCKSVDAFLAHFGSLY